MKKRPSINEAMSAVRNIIATSHYKTLSDVEYGLNIHNIAFPGGVVSSDSDRQGRVLYSPAVVRDDGSHIGDMLKKAETDPLYFDAACARGSIEILGCEKIQPELRQFLSQVLAGVIERPPGLQGRKSWKQLQDQFVAVLVAKVVELGFRPTRNDASTRRDSACDIVADAMGEAGLKPAKYASIKDIWEKRENI